MLPMLPQKAPFGIDIWWILSYHFKNSSEHYPSSFFVQSTYGISILVRWFRYWYIFDTGTYHSPECLYCQTGKINPIISLATVFFPSPLNYMTRKCKHDTTSLLVHQFIFMRLISIIFINLLPWQQKHIKIRRVFVNQMKDSSRPLFSFS